MSDLEIGPILRALTRNKTRVGLIVVEIALTLAIVANCVTFILDSREKMRHPSGFDDDNLISVRTTVFDPAYRADRLLDRARSEELARLRSIPGVKSASNTRFLPWQGGGSSIEVRESGTNRGMLQTQIYNADEATFQALGIVVTEGQGFTAEAVTDDALRIRALLANSRELGPDNRPKTKSRQAVVVSRAFARLVFGNQSPLGKVFEDSDGDLYPVVGVIDNFYNPYGWPIGEYGMFFMGYSRSFEFGAPYLVRAEPNRAPEVAAAVEHALASLTPPRSVKVQTLPEIKAQYFVREQVVIRLMGGVAVLLVMVTGLGIVGLTTFSVTERTRQIGTRRALGATRAAVIRHFVVESALVTCMGTILGITAAYGINIALVSFTQAPKIGGGLLAGGAALLWVAGIVATLVPAMRAARVSPAIATRTV